MNARATGRWRRWGWGLMLAVGCAADAELAAQRPGPDSVTVVAGDRYQAGAMHRFLLGSEYRQLWATPIRVPVLLLDTLGGGARAVNEGGGLQTQSLAIETPAGRAFRFRSLDKYQRPRIPEAYHSSWVGEVVQDQVHAMHPGGAVAVGPMLDALGISHAPARLVVLADTRALGEFRGKFAGMLGTIQEHPDEAPGDRPGFDGFRKVAGTDKLIPRVNEDADERVDAAAFLTARLLDFVTGDFDRHHRQWRWGSPEDGGIRYWVPIPEDRDQVFARYDGFLLQLGRVAQPTLVTFDPHLDVRGLTRHSRQLDRRFLSPLELTTWDSIAASVQDRLSDEVIDDGLGAMPAPYHAGFPGLRAALVSRREELRQAARRYYRRLAEAVDVHGTDGEDAATLEFLAGGDLVVTVTDPRRGAGEAVFFRRRFRPDETAEVRVYLHGGADSASVTGDDRRIRLRVIGGNGDDRLTDDAGSGGGPGPLVRFHDLGLTMDAVYAVDTLIDGLLDRRPLDPRTAGRVRLPPRDAGRVRAFGGSMGIEPGLGAVIDVAAGWRAFGFRRYPYASETVVRAAMTTGLGAYRAGLTHRRYAEGTRFFSQVAARYSTFGPVQFFGYGNESLRNGSAPLKLRKGEGAAEIGVGDAGGELRGGLVVRLASTEAPTVAGPAAVPVRGVGTFGQAGVRARGEFSSERGPAGEGVTLSGAATLYPAIWDAAEPFGKTEAEATAAFRIPGLPIVAAFRAAGSHAWGAFPLHEAAFLGGTNGLRGYAVDRFAGNSAVSGSAELRIPVARVNFPVPGSLGAFGLADAGRVFAAGEISRRWHRALGGGLWLDVLDKGAIIHAALARGREGTTLTVGGGLGF